MNEKRLRIYLDDHLALLVAEVELIGRCWRSNRRLPLGNFLQQLENDVRAQQGVTKDVIHRFGGKNTVGRLKQCAGWFAEKVGRLKLNDSLLTYSDLSRVVELETMTAAAQMRVGLWDNLDALVNHDSRLDGILFSQLRDESQRHLEELQTQRRLAAVTAFSG